MRIVYTVAISAMCSGVYLDANRASPLFRISNNLHNPRLLVTSSPIGQRSNESVELFMVYLNEPLMFVFPKDFLSRACLLGSERWITAGFPREPV